MIIIQVTVNCDHKDELAGGSRGLYLSQLFPSLLTEKFHTWLFWSERLDPNSEVRGTFTPIFKVVTERKGLWRVQVEDNVEGDCVGPRVHLRIETAVHEKRA